MKNIWLLGFFIATVFIAGCCTYEKDNYPTSLDGKTLYAAYTSGKPAGKVLEVAYAEGTFMTKVLPNDKSLNGRYQYTLIDADKGIATMKLIPNQDNFNGSTQELTFQFKSSDMATFSDKTLKGSENAGGILYINPE